MRRLALAVVAVLAALLVWTGAAVAWPPVIAIDAPGRHVDPATVEFNGADHPGELRAHVFLPDGYDGRREFPILYLLHGVGDDYRSWVRRGRVAETLGDFGAIVVMPEAARGFYSDWWNGGRRGAPGWESYYLEELIPLIESRFAVREGRRWHAIAGLSMGGFGAAYLGSRRPDYFGSVATFSGFVSIQRPELAVAFEPAAGAPYEEVFGPMEGFYAAGHNPVELAENLRSTRTYVTVGNGIADAGSTSPAALVGGGVFEAGLKPFSDDFVAAARSAGVDVTYAPLNGTHDWPYWRHHLRAAIRWGLFEPVPEAPTAWTYRTVAGHGQAWDLGYSFAAPPTEVVTLERDGAVLRGSGSGSVTIRNPAGCGFSAELPFERPLPPPAC